MAPWPLPHYSAGPQGPVCPLLHLAVFRACHVLGGVAEAQDTLTKGQMFPLSQSLHLRLQSASLYLLADDFCLLPSDGGFWLWPLWATTARLTPLPRERDDVLVQLAGQ